MKIILALFPVTFLNLLLQYLSIPILPAVKLFREFTDLVTSTVVAHTAVSSDGVVAELVSEELKVRQLRRVQTASPEEAGGDQVECAVCLCPIEEGVEVRELRCDHLFHRACLDRWVGQRRSTCPLCRDYLVVPPPSPEAELRDGETILISPFGDSGRVRDTWWLR